MKGRRVAQYEIRETLGGGGMGVVYKAWDTSLDRFVALKFLPPAVGSDEGIRKRFIREAKAASAVDHPNICTIHEIGETEEGQLFICMAYCDGRSLKDEMAHRPIGASEALAIGSKILGGLARAHAAGVVHRDLKPANVMLTADGDVKIVDFGLAQVAHEEGLTRTGASMGTPGYMSPEQVRGEKVDHRTDLWSVGVLLSAMLGGRLPFEASSQPAMYRAILEQEPTPVRALGAPVSAEVERVVTRLLAKDPADRFATAREALAALAAAAGEASPEAVSMLETAVKVPPGPAAARPRRLPRLPRLRHLRHLRKRYLFALAAALAASALTFVLARPEGKAQGEIRLAVLPFDNFTGDEARSYLSDGLAAGVITSLSALQGLEVLSRSEAWSYRERNLGSVELAHRLGVEALLEGSLRRDHSSLVVDTKLLDAEGTVQFSQEFRGSEEETMELQRRIGRYLADILEIPLNRRERSRLAEVPTESFRAFELYLRGQQVLDRGRSTTHGSTLGDSDAGEAAVVLFQEAIRLDPGFALAYTGLSEAHWIIAQRERSAEPLALAREAAEKALEIDPGLPAALVALARLERTSGSPSQAITALREALEKHPHPDEAQRELGMSYEAANQLRAAESAFQAATLVGGEDWYNWNGLGAFYWRLGKYDQAQTAFERAAAVAPPGTIRPQENLATLDISRGRYDDAIDAFEKIEGPIRSAILASNVGTAYYFSQRPGHLDKAGEYYRLAVRLNPRDDDVRRNLADLLLHQGRKEEAMENYRAARELVEERLDGNPSDHELRLRRAFYAAKAEDCALAGEILAELLPELPEMAQNAHRSAYVFALCGRREEALAELRRAIDLGVTPSLLRDEDEFASLRSEPEFLRLVGATPPG